MVWNIKKQKNNNLEQGEKRTKKNEDSVSNLWDNFKHSSIHITGVPEVEEKEQEIGTIYEKIVKENFPNLVKEIDMQFQEVQGVPNKMDAMSPTLRHIIIKMSKVKDKERIFEAAREKQLFTYRGVLIRQSADFSKETLQGRRD